MFFDELADHDIRAYQNCYPNIQSRDALWVVVGAPPVNRIKQSFYYKLEQQIRKDPDWYFIHWTTWDNAEFLPGGRPGIQKEKDAYYRRGEWDEWECRYEARYIFGGRGTVLSNFVPDIYDERSNVVPHDIIMSRLPSHERRRFRFIRVFDPGYSSVFCVLFAVFNPYLGQVYILDEIYETDRNRIGAGPLWERVKENQRSFIQAANGKICMTLRRLAFQRKLGTHLS